MIALTISATPAAAQSPARSLWLPSLRELLAAYDVPLVQGAPPDLEQHVSSYAVEDAADLFVIGFHPASRATTALPETLHVSAFDRRARTWAHARLQRHRQGAPAWDAGAVVKIHHTDRHVFLDTHHSPSAGTIVVLSRSLAPVTALAGWVRRILPSGVILYQRSSIHFAPTHSVELWTWDESSVRDVRLYPGTTSDSLRRAYVDTVRAIYRRAGEAWFRTNNHHMDPERFDSRLYGAAVVEARTAASGADDVADPERPGVEPIGRRRAESA